MKHKNSSEHTEHTNHLQVTQYKEYVKFVLIMVCITVISLIHVSSSGMSIMQFTESFMGVFFVVFAGFKLAKLKEFAYGFQSYDLIAKHNLPYAFVYPFVQLVLGCIYLLGLSSLPVDVFVLVISLVSGAGVLNSLKKKQKVHCVCLGNVIKLPLSTISFVEDFGMAIMAFVMILFR